jgi:acyl carrier protein
MQMSSTRRRLREVINRSLRANISEEVFASAQRLDELVIVDSLTIIEFAMAIEAEFGIDLTSTNPGRELLMDLNRLEARLRDAARSES